ncbi:phage capsid protein [Enterococcus hirae]|nr:phage capsid protein [Enterococcus hirae]
MKSPQQTLFDELFKASLALGYATFDEKPSNNTKYPFVEFEYTQEVNLPVKAARIGNIPIVLSVWGDKRKRNQVAEMVENLFKSAVQGLETSNYIFTLNLGASSTTIQTDTSTNQKLYRGLLELEFNYS